MKEIRRLVQIKNQTERRIALVKEPKLMLINGFNSIYDLAVSALEQGLKLVALIAENLSSEELDYEAIYRGESEWKLLPSFDNPHAPMSCLVAGTGLTHKNSALNRQMMHQAADDKPTDSMQMYQWGVEGGTPAPGEIGVQPEWFYKGNGAVLKAHGEYLEVPLYGNDGGEEPEVAGVYLVDKNGTPYRIGFTTGNEFSDHVMEKKNYLYLAPSKLRQCAIGPELAIDADFLSLNGKVSVSRKGEKLWSADIQTGEENMAHNLSNLEYHHFKYDNHLITYQSHVHLFGADAFSFGNKIRLQDEDEMKVEWNGLGRPLCNKIKIRNEKEELVEIKKI